MHVAPRATDQFSVNPNHWQADLPQNVLHGEVPGHARDVRVVLYLLVLVLLQVLHLVRGGEGVEVFRGHPAFIIIFLLLLFIAVLLPLLNHGFGLYSDSDRIQQRTRLIAHSVASLSKVFAVKLGHISDNFLLGVGHVADTDVAAPAPNGRQILAFGGPIAELNLVESIERSQHITIAFHLCNVCLLGSPDTMLPSFSSVGVASFNIFNVDAKLVAVLCMKVANMSPAFFVKNFAVVSLQQILQVLLMPRYHSSNVLAAREQILLVSVYLIDYQVFFAFAGGYLLIVFAFGNLLIFLAPIKLIQNFSQQLHQEQFHRPEGGVA